MTDANSLEFKIAFELTILEFCENNATKSAEEVKAYLLANPEIIAERIKAILGA